MDFVTHLPRTLRKHDVVWVIVDWLTKVDTFFGCADNLHTRGILQVVHTRDCTVAWSANLHSIGSKSQVYSSVLEELLESYGDIVEDEYYFSSTY